VKFRSRNAKLSTHSSAPTNEPTRILQPLFQISVDLPLSTLNTSAKNMSNLETAYVATKQRVLEAIGSEPPALSENPDLNDKIERLYTQKVSYEKLIEMTTKYRNQFDEITQTQSQLGTFFLEASVKEKEELWKKLQKIGESHKSMSKYRDAHVKHYDQFIDTLTTFKEKAIADALASVKKFEEVRLEYDGWRTQLKELEQEAATKGSNPKLDAKISIAKNVCQEKRTHFEKATADLTIKLDILEEKRIADMHRYFDTYILSLNNFYANIQNSLNEVAKDKI